ncbi:MAG: TolC family protein, partial [Flavobacteriales bacterium]|nr:TolC family protein [Flavobacteriales bacterium]
RASLEQAKIYLRSTEFEQRSMINDLLLDASSAYWNWFQAYHVMGVYEEAVEFANLRFEGVKQLFIQGDSPGLDTVEARIQLQNRVIALESARLDYNNAKAFLGIYLWADGETPLEVDLNTFPESIPSQSPQAVGNLGSSIELIEVHPDLQQYRLYVQSIGVDVSLSREMLKPKVDVKYNALNAGASGGSSEFVEQYSLQNYTWGVSVEMPLFLRKERGELQKNSIKFQQATFGLDFKKQELVAKFNTSLNDLSTSNALYFQAAQNASDYLVLLQGERELFRNGESSLFLINRRELGYISAQLKQIELLSKNQLARIKVDHSLGVLGS